GAGGALRDRRLRHFPPHALPGRTGKSRARANAGELAFAIGRARAEGCVNAEKPEDAQIVFRDTPVRIADKAHAPCGDIVESTDVIVHHAVGADRKAVNSEVAPLRIADPGAAECDLRLAAERLGVLA